MRRTTFYAFLLFTLSFGCASSVETPGKAVEPAPGPPVPGDWIFARLEADPDILSPVLYKTAPSQYAMFGANNSLIFEHLLRYNPKTWLLTEPLLAESYPDISADHLTYTYRLRSGVTWHDGHPLTPEDVLFTFKAAMCPLVDSADKRGSLVDLANVEILSDRTIRFTFSKPSVFNIHNTGDQLGIIPKHLFDPSGLLDALTYEDIAGPKGKSDQKIKEFSERFNKHSNNRMPVGTGPYKFEKWETGREIRLVRNDTYFGKKAYLSKIIFRVIPDSIAALNIMKSGELDLNAFMLPGQTIGASFVNATISIPQYQYIGWNEDRPFFKDKRVRQGLAMLVDRTQILEKVRFGLGQVAVTPFSPTSPYFNTNIKPLAYEPKRAAALLDQAGWTDHDGDGVRDKDGVAFRFAFVGAASSAFTVQLVAILKDEFKKVGIQLEEQMGEPIAVVKCLQEHNCDAAAGTWIAPLEMDPYQVFHSTSTAKGGSNWIHFRNAESDRLLEQARSEFDPKKRKQIYWRWQELIHDEQPYTFLLYPQVPVAYHKRFQNVDFLPTRPGYNLNEWFVPLQNQKYK